MIFEIALYAVNAIWKIGRLLSFIDPSWILLFPLEFLKPSKKACYYRAEYYTMKKPAVRRKIHSYLWF
jgi:hypothetical protein